MISVNAKVVAEYYIECELDNIVTGENITIRKDAYNTNLIRLLEALSFTYRANSVFDYVYNNQFRWEKRVIAAEDITLTGMGEHLSKIIYSDEVQQNPQKFVEYIKSHQNDEHLLGLQGRPVPKNRQIILTRESEGSLKMLDGSHRFISMIMTGLSSFTTYVAVPAEEVGKPMIGDAIFLRLRRLWQQTDNLEFKESIEKTIIGMVNASSDGLQAAEAYWVFMAPNEEVRAAGERIMEDSKASHL